MVKKGLLFLAIIAIVGTGLFVVLQNKQSAPADLLEAEQEVYATLLSYQSSTYSYEFVFGTVIDKHQIIEYTNRGEMWGSTPMGKADDTGSFVLIGFTDLQRKTWIDYLEKNEDSYPIKGFLPPTANVKLVNPANGEQLYWWVSFSRIGFNSSLTQALVLVEDCRGDLCFDGSGDFMYRQGYYVFLQKENGEWIIKDQLEAWLIEAPSP